MNPREAQSFDDLLSALLRTERPRPAEHPSSEELVEYAFGALSNEEEGRLQDHFALCGDCGRLVLDLVEAQDAEPAEGGLSSWELEVAWREMERRLEDHHEIAAPGRRAEPPRIVPQRWSWSIAASLILAVGALLLRQAGLERQLAALQEPRVDVAVMDLFESGTVRGSEEPAHFVASDSPRVLLLSAPVSEAFDSYQLSLFRDESSEPIWRSEALQPNPYGSFQLLLPPRLLPAGSYRLVLLGLEDGQHELVAGYEFGIREEHGKR